MDNTKKLLLTAYDRYRYSKLLDTDMRTTIEIVPKLDKIFAELKDNAFNPIDVTTAIEELRSDKGIMSYKDFEKTLSNDNDEKVLRNYLTVKELNTYRKNKSSNDLKYHIKNTTCFKIKDKDKIFYFKKSLLPNIYELKVLERNTDKMLTLKVLETIDTEKFVIRMNPEDISDNMIKFTVLDNYKEPLFNYSLGDEVFVNANYITYKDSELNALENNTSLSLSPNDFEFVEPQVSADNLSLSRIDTPDLAHPYLALNIVKNEKISNAIFNDKDTLFDKKFELKMKYDIYKNTYKLELAPFDSHKLDIITNDKAIMDNLKDKFKLNILQLFSKSNDIIKNNDKMGNLYDLWIVDNFADLIKDMKSNLDIENAGFISINDLLER